MSKSVGISSATLKKGLASIGSGLLGVGLVNGLKNIVTGYAEAAKAAGDLAAATGSSIEDVSRMQAALEDAGISAEQSAAMLTKFTTVLSTDKGKSVLQDLNVELVKAKNGTTDFAKTMTAAVDEILKVGDASERSRQLTVLFGKQGATAFQDLIASGMSLSDAMAQIDTSRVFDNQDYINGLKFDEALDKLAASASTAGKAIGATLLPMVNALLAIIVPLVNGISSLDTVTLGIVASGAALLKWGAAIRAGLVAIAASSAAAAKSILASGAAAAAATGQLAAYAAALKAAGIADATVFDSGSKAKGMAKIIAGTVAIAAAWEVASRSTGAYQRSIDEVAASTDQLTLDTARATLEQQSLWEKLGGSIKDLLDPGAWLDTLTLGLAGTSVEERTLQDLEESQRKSAEAYEASKEQARQAAEQQGAYAANALEASEAQDALNNMIAEGGHSQEELATAAHSAAVAQNEQEIATKAAKDMMDAAIVTTDELVEATLALFTSDIAHARALNARKDAVKAAKDALKEYNNLEKDQGESAAHFAQREATARRAAADSILEVKEASLNAAQAYVAEKTASLEAAGQFVTDAQKRTFLFESLKRQADAIPKSLPEAKQAVADLAEQLKNIEFSEITVSGIRYKQGVTKDMVNALENQIREALALGDVDLAETLQEDLNELKVPPMPVLLVDENGNPLTDAVINPTVGFLQGFDEVLSVLEGQFESNPIDLYINTDNAKGEVHASMTDEPVTVPLAVSGISEEKSKIHSGLTDENVTVQLAVGNIPAVKGQIHSGLTDEKVTIQLAVGNLAAVKSQIHSYLTGEVVTIRVQANVSSAQASIAGLNRTSQMNSLLGPQAMGLSATTQGAVTYNQSFSIDVSGAGSPAITAREIDRYIRRAGDPRQASVTA
jgi:hypothetical protein